MRKLEITTAHRKTFVEIMYKVNQRLCGTQSSTSIKTDNDLRLAIVNELRALANEIAETL